MTPRGPLLPMVLNAYLCTVKVSGVQYMLFSELLNVQNAFATGALPWWYWWQSHMAGNAQ